jgi:MFS family permease
MPEVQEETERITMHGDLSAYTGGSRGSGTQHEFGLRARKMLLLATLATLILMLVPYANILLYPLRLFITFVHESGHALGTVLTGGQVASLHVFPNGEGLTRSQINPIWQWVVISGGYLGTAIFGAMMLQVGRMKRWRYPGRTALFTASIGVLAATFWWAFHPFTDPFTFFLGIGLAGVLFALARVLSPDAADFVSSFLAVQCCLNALGDIGILLHLTTTGSPHNDAGIMAKTYGLGPTFWAALWGLMAIGILTVSLRSYWRATRR